MSYPERAHPFDAHNMHLLGRLTSRNRTRFAAPLTDEPLPVDLAASRREAHKRIAKFKAWVAARNGGEQ